MESASHRRTGRTIVVVLIVLAALACAAMFVTGGALGGLAGSEGDGVFAEIRIRPSQQLRVNAGVEHEGKFEVYRQTHARLIKSHFVLQEAIRSPEIAKLELIRRQSHPINWLEENLQVSSPGKEFLRVSLPGHKSSEAAAIVNAVVESYMREVVHKEDETRRKRLSELEKIAASVAREVERLRADSRRQRELMTAPPTPEVELLDLDLMRQEYTRLRLKRIELDAALAGDPTQRDADTDKTAAESDPQRRQLETVKRQIEACESEFQAVLDREMVSSKTEIALAEIERQIARKEEILERLREQIEKLTIELNAPIGIAVFRRAEPVE